MYTFYRLGRKKTVLLTFALAATLHATAQTEQAGTSPWGPADEIGTLNMMSDSNNLSLFAKIRTGKVYDLGVEYFTGMPGFTELGDPAYQYWLTHTPRGTVVGNHTKQGGDMNRKVSYTGDAISMYTHTGTHIDALNHFGLHGKIWNGYTPDEHLSDRGWDKTGAEKIPPIIGKGVLIDVPAYKGVEVLPGNYVISLEEIQQVIKAQQLQINKGDIVLIRTGLMKYFYNDREKFMQNSPGISMEALKWLVEEKGVMTLGADNLSLEALPSKDKSNWLPGHTYLLAQKGSMFIELVYLEDLAKAKVRNFLFVGLPLKIRGASAAPMRPLAIPL
ncbi:cyclase family protein [Chitinophaga nivalis]|uniref:Cyclase family protein n=1 Tax=Chitinophaga nivalis TaxID=2991709 RepID=A0ABT3IJX9_9BACT|nr:cyclase family protein [Chitinophaga nivalis]MCW3466033.1 cyclase family protein [Chitinophaga nivalis]MCW3484276.1 cyclase family protein [Chitinophaga nivalis]